MKTLTLFFCTALSTACGQAADATKKADTETTATKTEATVPDKQPVTKEEAKPTVAPDDVAEKPPQITKDQMLRASIRLGFDAMLRDGKLFHDTDFKTYFFRGDEGAMGYPDSQYLPVTTKNLSVGCPMGFKQVGQIDLSVGISHGLFDHLPPDSQWVWTSWKSSSDVNASYAMVTSDFTDAWGFHFDANMFYPKHRNRVLGRLYCMMTDFDLPNIDDLPAGYFDSLRGT